MANRFIREGYQVVGLDSINDYYNPQLKFDRLAEAGIASSFREWRSMIQSARFTNYRFIRAKLANKKVLQQLFDSENFDLVIHLAAQPGVRYSLKYPEAYIESNIMGFLNILESCRHHGIGHLVFASSSSVYGLNKKMPLSADDNVDHPASLYAATKKSNELMAHSYSHLFQLPVTGLRFFTVYGPWGRPDMAADLFTTAIRKGEKIKIFNQGNLSRDFTYIDDIVEGVFRVSNSKANSNPDWSDSDGPASAKAPYRIYNIGNNHPIKLMTFIETLEQEIGQEAEKLYLPMQPGDVHHTYADISGLEKDFGYKPTTSLKEGIKAFVQWHKLYY